MPKPVRVIDWSDFTPEEFNELEAKDFSSYLRQFQNTGQSVRWTWEKKIALALIENARSQYPKDSADIEAWMNGGTAGLMFRDVCEGLGVSVEPVKKHIRKAATKVGKILAVALLMMVCAMGHGRVAGFNMTAHHRNGRRVEAALWH